MIKKHRCIALTGTAVVSLVASLAGVAVAAAPAGAQTSHTLTVSVSKSHHVTAQRTTRPGVTRVRATGAFPIELFSGGAKAAGRLVSDLNTALRKGTLKKVEQDFAFGGEIDQGYDGYLPLQRGTYYVVSDGGYSRSHLYRTSQVATISVSGSRLDASTPRSDRVGIAGDGAVGLGSMTRHVKYARLVNTARHDVAVAAVRVGNSVAPSKVRHFLAHPSFSHLGDVSPGRYPDYRIAQEVPAGETVTLPQFLTAGRYVVIVVEYVNGRMQDHVDRRQATSFVVH